MTYINIMSKKYFSLEKLDEYAKVLSSKQVSMLYENRMHKKYKKSLFEGIEDGSFSVYVSNNVLDDKGELKSGLLARISEVAKYANCKNVQDGFFLYTKLPTEYKSILKEMAKLGLGEYVKGSVKPGYEQYLIAGDEI